LKEETRGIIEKKLDHFRFGFKDIEAIQEITPIENEEEFLFGYTIGYLSDNCEMAIFLLEGKVTKTDEKELRKIIHIRIPEIRKKLMAYLNR
jgi:hypothetical protein